MSVCVNYVLSWHVLYCFLSILLPQTNITSQMWPRGGKREHLTYCQLHATVDFYNINGQLTTVFSSYRKQEVKVI